MTHIRFNDEAENYEPSDSDEDFTEKEKALLKKVRNKRPMHSDSEEEVYGLDVEDSDNSGIADSDIDGKDDDDLPDVRAWGKNKRNFYSADYVDPDYGGYQGKDAVLADLEEEEAQNIKKRLAQQLDDDDFALETFDKKVVDDVVEKDVEIVKSDLSTLPKRQLLELLRRESPEFFQLLEDYREKMKVVKEYMVPIIKLVDDGLLTDCKALDFVKTYYHLLVGYCTNINMYLLLKASELKVQNHPIIKRLYQYRKLIAHLEPIYVEIIKPQLDTIIQSDFDQENSQEPNEEIKKIKKKTNKKLKLLKNFDNKTSNTKAKTEEPKRVSFNLPAETEEPKQIENPIPDSSFAEELQEEEPMDNDQTDEQSEITKRAITYQMKKNKGLTPQRKKEQRNPRVKHRNKYRKAIIRRKGAVREVRKELSRYGGEISGIKTSVTKSIKIK